MEQRYPDTLRHLVDSFPTLSPELQKAARYMVDHPEEIGLNSLRKVAADARVKPATITRLTKKLGYSDYDALREPFCQRLRLLSPGFSSRLQNVQERGGAGNESLLADLRAAEMANVQQALSFDNYRELDEAAETMQDSARVFVLGLRGAYAPAFLFHYAYRLFRDNSTLLDTRAGIFADSLRGIGSDDCLLAVSFPPYTLLTIDIVEFAVESNTKVIAVTDSPLSPAAVAATHTIPVGTQSPSFYHSLTGALAVVQALITLLVAKSGGDAVKIIEDAEKQLSRISAYW